MTRITDMRGDLKGQRSRLQRHIDRLMLVAHNWTTKGRRSTKIGRKVVRSTADIAQQLQGQKIRGHMIVIDDLGGS